VAKFEWKAENMSFLPKPDGSTSPKCYDLIFHPIFKWRENGTWKKAHWLYNTNVIKLVSKYIMEKKLKLTNLRLHTQIHGQKHHLHAMVR
jgi:hypothetical protein